MAEENKIGVNDLAKAIAAIQDLSKGHSSRGTASTTVDSMTGESGATQVFHTPSNSDPGSWAGTTARPVKDNGASDSISENGTDYKGGSAMVKSIMDKLSKGIPLSPAEYTILKGFMPDKVEEKDEKKPPMAKSKDNDEDDEDSKEDVSKTLKDEADDSDEVSKGMEISTFLADFVDVFNKSLGNLEARLEAKIVGRLEKSLSAESARSEEFGKSLAGALGTLGEALAVQVQRVDQVERAPARGPKSIQADSVLSKSLGEELTKGMITDTLVSMVEDNKIPVAEVIRFETTGRLPDELGVRVRAYRAGR